MKKIKMYLHSSKEANAHTIEEEKLNLDKDARALFLFALYEVEFDVEVNEETGEAKVVAVSEDGINWLTNASESKERPGP